ncbi:hypothetical protein [Roseateles sp.]|uniref:hypothetical protein n=1 Tax=Roseateles sp. TaxID=1971397 RepID=UPI0025F930F5|nr:hypothetical protein [Roseateles sp.]MBV8036079.1 hypothetical protein [Roseateles sp.]
MAQAAGAAAAPSVAGSAHTAEPSPGDASAPPARQGLRGLDSAALQALSFETLERDVRAQLNRMLGGSGFDAARDIADINVCRWAHGYAAAPMSCTTPRMRPGLSGASAWAASRSLTRTRRDLADQRRIRPGPRAAMEIVNDVVRPVYGFRWSERDGTI